MVGRVWRSGKEGDEMGEGADGIERAFEGRMCGDGGLETDSVGKRVSLSDAVADRDVHGRSQTVG